MVMRHFMMRQSFAMATPLSPRVMTKLWQNMGSAKPCDGLISKSLSSARDCFELCLGFELYPMGKLWPVMRAEDVPFFWFSVFLFLFICLSICSFYWLLLASHGGHILVLCHKVSCFSHGCKELECCSQCLRVLFRMSQECYSIYNYV